MPRMLRRAAVLGATAHVASKRGQARAEQQAAEAAPPLGAPRRPPRPSRLRQPASQDTYADLMKLKELLDAGVLTQEEFDAQKAKILSA